mmetsp:Transcript_114509/g.310909  ORF Transcript_114509/g.310909 Transcript_114509/m.310909 type:complete len:258 (-) Transcript_114509:160-933(-)
MLALAARHLLVGSPVGLLARGRAPGRRGVAGRSLCAAARRSCGGGSPVSGWRGLLEVKAARRVPGGPGRLAERRRRLLARRGRSPLAVLRRASGRAAGAGARLRSRAVGPPGGLVGGLHGGVAFLPWGLAVVHAGREVCEVRALRLPPLVGGHLLRVQLPQAWQALQDVHAVVGQVGAGVVVEPQHSEVPEVAQILHLRQVPDVVLPEVQLGEPRATAQVVQRVDSIDAQAQHFEVRHLADHTNVLQVVAPQVEVLD